MIRQQISDTYSQWCAFSSTRSGSPLKAKPDVYPLIRLPHYNELFIGDEPISKSEFDAWHKRSTIMIHEHQPLMPVGWCTKLINVYLKTLVYVGGFGRPNLSKYIHPPIDGGLWKGIKQQYGHDHMIISKTHYREKIKDIRTYDDYRIIISGMELITMREKIMLIEVEKYWQGTL